MSTESWRGQTVDKAEDLPIDTILPSDKVFTRGTQAYAAKGGRFAA